ncbi:MAG: hypothetical protein ABI091_14780 [Ferruginibacter sp.]
MNQTLEVLEVEAEEIPLEKKIENALVKENVTDKVIASLKEKYGSLRLKSIDDKESYLEIKDGIKHIRKVEIIGEKIFKSLREDAIKTQKYCLSKEKEFLSKTGEFKNPLDGEAKKFEDEVERKEIYEKKKREAAFQQRQSTLIKYGAHYNNGSFELNHISYEIDNIRESDQEIWESIILPKYKSEFEKLEAIKVAQEKEREAESLKLKQEQNELIRQREEMDKQRRELADAQAAIQKMRDDSEREKRLADQKKEDEEKEKRNKVVEARIKRLYSINISKSPYIDKSYSFVDDGINYSEQLISNKISIPGDLFSLSDTEWDNLFESLTGLFESKKKEVEAKRLSDAEEQKKKDIEAALQKERDRIAEEKRLSDIRAEQERLKKEDALAQANDKTKWNEFLNQVWALKFPEMKSGIYKRKVTISKEKIEEINLL